MRNTMPTGASVTMAGICGHDPGICDLPPPVTMTGIAGHDAGMCGHDETEYAVFIDVQTIACGVVDVPTSSLMKRFNGGS
jgi:hypothetical protein